MNYVYKWLSDMIDQYDVPILQDLSKNTMQFQLHMIA
jgi:hypothetical protein